ncbi:fibronectin type III domain-containing protein [Myxococcota bacterium]|nr:fibronectin type III domain-containing protein [Myxococcota bacterium]
MIGLWLLASAWSAEPAQIWDLEDDDGGFTVAADELQWEWGAFSALYGPGGGVTGQRGWATRISAPYLNDLDASVRLAPATVEPGWVLELRHWYSLDISDLAVLERFTSGGWEVVPPYYDYPTALGFTGASGGWISTYFGLDDVGNTSELRLSLYSDQSVQAEGWYIDELVLWDGDAVPPLVRSLQDLTDTEDLNGPYTIESQAFEDDGALSLTLVYSLGEEDPLEIPLRALSTSLFRGEIVHDVPPGTTIRYHVLASDGVNETRYPADSELSFRVRLPAPTDLAGPTGRVVATTARLTWTAPKTSLHELEGYRVYRGGDLVAETSDAEATVPLAGGGADVFSVSAVYDAGEGDLSEPIFLDVALPSLDLLSPAEAWSGEQVRARLIGDNLLLVQDEVSVSLGDGVTVRELSVLTVDELSLLLEIDEDAVAGKRELLLTSGSVTLAVPEVFEVLGGDGGPRLLSVTPTRVRQGERATLCVTASAPFYEPPSISLGEGVVIESTEQLDDTTACAEIVVEPQAALGERVARVDDGRRLYTNLSVQIRDNLSPPTGSCASGGAGASGLGAAFALLFSLSRRRSPRR